MTIALYPGTFDPITHGHCDIIKRASTLFDKLVIAVAPSEEKKTAFPFEKRLHWVNEVARDFPNISVRPLGGLTIDLARQVKASIIIRGLRAVSDFEYEFQMAQMNRHLSTEIETLFLMTSPEFLYVSSSIVKQIAQFDPTRVKDLVPPSVWKELSSRT